MSDPVDVATIALPEATKPKLQIGHVVDAAIALKHDLVPLGLVDLKDGPKPSDVAAVFA